MNARVATELRIDPKLMVAATEKARRDGISRSELFRQAIAAHVKGAA